MDEVFPGQRIGSMVWRKRRASNAAGVEHFFSSDHEHVRVRGAEFSFGGSAKPGADTQTGTRKDKTHGHQQT